jgi:hypothetical protein
MSGLMMTRCRKCGAELAEGAGRCPQCLAVVKPPGLLRRLFDRLGVNFRVSVNISESSRADAPTGVHVQRTLIRTERIEIADPVTGEKRVYESLGDVPEQYRKQLEAFRAQHRTSAVASHTITVRDADGTERTYKSLDEMPPRLQKLVEVTCQK